VCFAAVRDAAGQWRDLHGQRLTAGADAGVSAVATIPGNCGKVVEMWKN